MKTLLTLLTGTFLSVLTYAQTITLSFKGNTNSNRQYQVVIDNNTYLSANATGNTANNGSQTISITTLPTGSHTLAVYRVRNNAGNNPVNTKAVYTNTFQTRQGYDMMISIVGNAEVSFTEKRIRGRNNSGNSNAQTRYPMADAEFTQLLQQVKSKWLPTQKLTLITAAFNNTAYNFSTTQIRHLLLLVKSEQSRLDLAKLAWMRVTDASNFTQLNDLFATQSSRDQLYTYTQNTNNNTTTNNNNNNNNNGYSNTAMATAQFNQLLQNVNYSSSQTTRFNTVRDALNNTSNYFSTSQLRQLIQAVTSETDRLYLAKIAFSRVTDAAYFNTLYDLFYSQANRDELARFTGQSTTNNTTNYNIKTPMTDAAFNQIYQAASGHFFQTSTVNAVRDAFNNTANIFSTSQLRQLLTLVKEETDRLALAKLGYPRASDQTSFSSLVDLFTTQINRDDFTRFIGGTTNNNTTYNNGQYSSRIPVTDAVFNQIYSTVNNHFRSSSKVIALKDAFNNTANYFSLTQIRQLLMLITTEADRLDLAKLAYRRASDPTYYSQLADLFTSQASKDDLNVYISANRY